MNIFYKPDISGDTITLDETESKHCIRVLRLVTGDKITLVDGKGSFYFAQITNPNPRHCELKITRQEKDAGKKNFRVHIAIAPTKNIDRFEWFLEKATEIGVDEITPILCFHSERKNIKNERLEKILVSAMKQSLKAYLPKLNQLTDFNSFTNKAFTSQKCIAHCYEGKKVLLKNWFKTNEDITIMIGPEGDFSENEIEKAKEMGFSEISLGQSRLRTETAGIVACHTINLINEKSE